MALREQLERVLRSERHDGEHLRDEFLGVGGGFGEVVAAAQLGRGQAAQLGRQGFVGIGTAAPTSRLDVAGFVNTDQYSGYKQAGNTILYASTTNLSTAVGQAAPWMSATSTALYGTAIGYQALNTAPTSIYAYYNTAAGYQSLFSNTSGSQNTAFGGQSLFSNQNGSSNTGVGFQSLYSNVAGANSTALGYLALYNNTAADNSVALGFHAARGAANYSNQGGTYVGYQSGYNAQTGSDYNTFLGYQAGYDVSTGARNLILGYFPNAATGVTTGSDNILLGNGVRAGLSQGGSNQLNIGNLIFGTGVGTGHGIEGDPDIYPVAAWSDLEGAEPTTAIASNATFGEIMQHLKRLFFNASKMDTTVKTIYRDDSATVLETQAINHAAPQTQGKAT